MGQQLDEADGAIVRLHQLIRYIRSRVTSARDREDLLDAICRFAVGDAGYAGAVITLVDEKSETLRPIAWQSVNGNRMAGYIDQVRSDEPPRTIAGWVLRHGAELICNDLRSLPPRLISGNDIVQAGYRSIIALPLRVDSASAGVFTLASMDLFEATREQVWLLEELAVCLEFALQLISRTQALNTVARFDPLTGLARRSHFIARLPARESIASGSVIVLDVAQLTAINLAIGHDRADVLIREIAEKLKRHFAGAENVGHIGGGTFAIALPQSLDTAQAVGSVRQRVDQLFASPHRVNGREVLVRMRCGIARSLDDGCDADQLLQHAEANLRAEKQAEESHLARGCRSTTEMITQVELEPRLRRAIDRQEFQIHYQPLVSLASGRIAAVEALLRWEDPERGLVLPGKFIPLLESANMMVEVGDWVLQQTAEDLQRWQRAGFGPLRAAVNISPQQLRRPDFVARMLALAARFPTSAVGIDIEITEAMLHHGCQTLIPGLQQLRQAGMRVAIDDFGTGYSSLGRLAHLPFDALKIDRSFVAPLPHDRTTEAVVGTIVSLGKALGLQTIAEGVEKPEQRQCLERMGCDWVQGFLHGAAAPASEIYAMLHAQSLFARPRRGERISRIES